MLYLIRKQLNRYKYLAQVPGFWKTAYVTHFKIILTLLHCSFSYTGCESREGCR